MTIGRTVPRDTPFRPGFAAPAGERVPIGAVRAAAFRVPTERPESDGTFEWRATTIVTCEIDAGGRTGLGYSYTGTAAAEVIAGMLAPAVEGLSAMAIPEAWARMRAAVRNIGRSGLAASAIAAVDVALWDLKAKLLNLSLLDLLGPVRDRIELYGSGGFTSQSLAELEHQLGGWAADGFRHVKMKVGREPAHDLDRVRAARRAIGPGVDLFVDANGAYERKQALEMTERFEPCDVCWFEEPVPMDDVEGLRLMRDRAPAGMAIAAGEYGCTPVDFLRLLQAGAVDVLQADATRCAGITGFLGAAALCESHDVPLSAHTAPAVHAAVCCAAPRAMNLEYFADHARLEWMLFDGAVMPVDGTLAPDRARPGLGIELKRADAERYAI